MTRPPLACSVRGCGRALSRDDRRYVCSEGHSYDIARSGYLNLLQPQDRRSLTAGDSADALRARVRLLEAGVGRALIESAVTLAQLALNDSGCGVALIVDLGCGAGDALAAVVEAHHGIGVGIDLSSAAVDLAARRFPAITWVVANADRRLPLLDGSATLVLSLHGRRNPDECARVLARDGCLLVAIPAPDDLVELRAAVHGEAEMRERGESLVAAHATHFDVRRTAAAREQRELDRETVVDLLRATYRGARSSARDTVESLSGMTVTSASEIVLFRKRRG